MERRKAITNTRKKMFRVLKADPRLSGGYSLLIPARLKSLSVYVGVDRCTLNSQSEWVNMMVKKVYPLKLCPSFNNPFWDGATHVKPCDSFFCCVFVSQSLLMPPVCFSPPPGKLAQKTGAQKAAKRSRQLLSTPNACAAGYPPTPC